MEILNKFTPLVLELIELKKERYGDLSLEFVASCMFLLDIMAYRKQKQFPQVVNGFEYIEKFDKILSKDVAKVIKNYIQNYIQD